MNIIHPERLPQWAGIEEAMHDVHKFTQATGKEKLIALSPEGRRIYTLEGNNHSVPLDQNADLSGSYIVHSHPVAAPVSPQDLGVASAFHTAGILATMPDGGWSASGGFNFIAGDPKNKLISGLYDYILQRALRWMQRYEMKGYNPDDAGISASFHIIDEAFFNDAIKSHKMELGPLGKRALHLAQTIPNPRGEPLRLE